MADGREEGDEDKCDRRSLVTELIKNISANRRKKEVRMKLTERTRGRGRYIDYKLQIGWLHHQKDKFRQVTVRKGGGTRTYTYPKDTEQTVEMLKEFGKNDFFPSGKSPMGLYSEMEVELSNYNGDIIEDFRDGKGEKCSLQEYLKHVGVFSSQFNLYLRTKRMSESVHPTELKPSGTVVSELEKLSEGFHHNETVKRKTSDGDEYGLPKKPCLEGKKYKVNGQDQGILDLRFTKVVESVYLESVAYVHRFSIEDCFSCSTEDTEQNGYNPINDGYTVTAISLNQNSFLDIADEDATCSQFQFTLANTELEMVLHSPGEIVGVERSNPNQLLFGVIIKQHNSGAFYSWYRNDEIYTCGTDLCFIQVTLPGKYSAQIYVGDIHYLCEPVIVSEEFDHSHLPEDGSSSFICQAFGATALDSVQEETGECGVVTKERTGEHGDTTQDETGKVVKEVTIESFEITQEEIGESGEKYPDVTGEKTQARTGDCCEKTQEQPGECDETYPDVSGEKTQA